MQDISVLLPPLHERGDAEMGEGYVTGNFEFSAAMGRKSEAPALRQRRFSAGFLSRGIGGRFCRFATVRAGR